MGLSMRSSLRPQSALLLDQSSTLLAVGVFYVFVVVVGAFVRCFFSIQEFSSDGAAIPNAVMLL